MIETKLISSLDRVFIDSKVEDFNQFKKVSALRGERVSFQLFVRLHKEPNDGIYEYRSDLVPKIEGPLSEYATMRTVRQVPVDLPVIPGNTDEHFERTEPGMYPDPLFPLTYGGEIIARCTHPMSLWVDIALPEDIAAGTYEVKTVLYDKAGDALNTETLQIEVINAVLPEQDLILTQWFHCDSLAQYYRVPVWSEEHWEIIENFARVAVKNGINLLLTPVFTPPLDTAIGGERLTTQLIDVTVTDGKYEFGFDRLDRWIDMCDRVGVRRFEISHLFTQWGAKHAPKIMATVDGEYKKIFGWETDALADGYVSFLKQFLTEFITHMKKRGDDQRCMFHISDEPQLEHLEAYSKAKAAVKDVLSGYPIMDALSNYDFWERDIVDLPIPCNDHIEPFIDNNVPNLWTYYCCGQCIGVSNRLIAMPSCRNRSIGMQMYKYDIVGFLQWGYNFYNNQFSVNPINPYTDVSGEYWVPAGDTFSVYPGDNGEALESLRILVFHEALQDMRAMKLCESLYSKGEVVKAIEDTLGDTLTFKRCSYTAENMLAIREAINKMIKAKV